IQDNIPFLGAVMEEKDFRKGDFTTAYIKDKFPEGFHGVPPTKAQEKLLIACSAVARSFTARRATETSGRAAPSNGAQRDWVVSTGGVHHLTHVDLDEAGADVVIDGKKHRFDTDTRPGARVIEGRFDG